MRYFVCFVILVVGFGTIDAQEFPISIATGDQINPDVAWDGTNFWVVWAGSGGVHGAKVTPQGQVDTVILFDYNGLMPAIAFGDSEGCVSFITPGIEYYYDIKFCTFGSRGQIITSGTIPSYPSYQESYGWLFGSNKTPISAFGRNNFFLFTRGWWDYPTEGWAGCRVFGVDDDTAINITPPYQWWYGHALNLTGIWNSNKFLAVWTQNPCDTFVFGVVGAFVDDSLIEQGLDTLEFKIRGDEEFPSGIFHPWETRRGTELAYSGSRYLLISETGKEYHTTSKIWFDVLSDSGLPIDSLPTIIDNGDSVNQTYPTCTYKDNKFYAVWQYSKANWTYLYGIEVDTLGQIGFSSKLPGFSNKIQPSITTGGDKLFLVWADDRNGNFDIYGMLMDSLSIEESEDTAYRVPTFLRCEPNPFIQKTIIEFRVKS
ncbi:MAG: hypothetical protein HY769_04000 [Candidatus Stahlbacteria bacterium]|nr:hypothetical protein [Candidatus Stahlbacteria bacterium]